MSNQASCLSTLKRQLSLAAIFTAVLYFSVTVLAGETSEENAELQTRVVKYHIKYYLNDDFTSYTENEVGVQVLKESAVNGAKSTTFSYSTSIEKMDISEAYTLKSDGTRIDVPKDNFQLRVNKGNREGGPVFPTAPQLTVVFPDVAVNDRLFVAYRQSQTEPMFPGHFTAQGIFYQGVAYDDVRIRINVPAGLDFIHQVRGMEEQVTVDGERKVITLSYSNPSPKKIRRQDYSVWDNESQPGFALSTFKDYKSIAVAYGARALPKAKPDARVKKLAREIVGKEKGKEQKARLLYDWVADNITYAGNCIGVGAVVPHDVAFILDNKMGDCKDHATLLQALLSAENIASTQALVNSGSAYRLPAIPMVSSVNHVINYLPELDRFVDVTSHTTPFDLLPFGVADKPVLLVEGYREGMTTPPMLPGQNFQQMETELHVQPDGSVKGKVKVVQRGMPAASSRSSWRHATEEQEKEWIENVFANQGVKGIGSISKEDPEPLESRYSYSVEFEKKGFLQGTGAGAFYVYPVVPTAAPVHSFVDVFDEEKLDYPVACGNGSSMETYVIHLPANMKVLASPDNVEIDEHHLHYSASYGIEGDVLKVSRVLEDKTPGNVCEPEIINQQRAVLLKIMENLESQVVYQRK